VVTHLYGWLADMFGILRAAEASGAIVIEDCAQAHGAMRYGRRAGSFGRLATFSFYPTKNLGAFGDGGAVVTDDDDLAGRLRSLRQYGWEEKYRATLAGGRNSRMDEMQSAILRVKLPWLDCWNARRREIVRRYAEAARGTGLSMLHEPGDDFVAHLAVARHADREGFRRRMAEAQVETAVHYPILDHRQAALEARSWRSVDLSASEEAAGEIVSLPCHAEMREDEIAQVCSAIGRAA
jgi:aminotransferase EvaB